MELAGRSRFGALLRAQRLALGLTQGQLADRAGLSRRGVQDLERGVRHLPQPGTAGRLADALGLTGEHLAMLLAAGTRPDLPQHASSSLRSSALPVRLTSFIGREREIEELRRRLEGVRLLTLVGAGGIGKTRLALEVAGRLAGEYTDNVFFVDVGPLAQPELVVQTMARALGLRTELDRHPQAAVLTFLARRHLLVILDNCEHLVEACAELAEAVLRACPDIRVLATSREALGVEGEVVWRLAPLDEPDAVRLFVERARAQRGDFDAGDSVTVGQVCRGLDHLPLAIELAAARVGVLEPAEMLPRLQDRFTLLRRVSGRAGSPRQQTLRATIDWSYELLEPAERQLFRRLAVFAGGFDLAAAQAMAGPDSLDVLSRLVDKSLVVAQQASGDRTHYRLLDTLRQYAWERLGEAGEVELARRRHLDHLLGRAEALFTPTDSVDGRTRQLDEYLDDLRASFEWCLGTDPHAGLRLIAATRDVWWRRSSAEGRRWAHVFLERCPEPCLTRAQALQAAGLLEALGDPAGARPLLLEARELAAGRDRATTAMVDYCLGFADFVAEHAAAAIEHLERAVATVDALGDVRGGAVLSVMLGWALLTDGSRREEARIRLEQNRQMGEHIGDRYTAGMADYGLGLYWRWTQHPRRALDHFRRCLERLRGLAVAPSVSGTLLHVARLLAASEPARAARLAGAGLAIANRTGVHLAPRLLRSIEELRAELARRLGDEQAQHAWAEGARLSMEEAIELALKDTYPESARPGRLSSRELELTQLVARGLSGPQIAELLHLSPRTVDNHLARIYAKVGLSNRLQLATWFVQTKSTDL